MPAASDLCTLLQQDLNNIARTNLATVNRTPVGMVDGLVSGQNTNGFEAVQVDPGNGKKKKVKVRYMQPFLDTDLDTAQASVCSGEDEPTPLEDEFEVTSFLRSQNLTLDKEGMRSFCESTSEWRARVIMAQIDAFMIGLNKQLVTQFVAAAGDYPDGTVAPRQIPLINQDAGGQYSADFWGENLLLEDFAQMTGNSQPITVGAGYLSAYARLRDIGCCNALGQSVDDFGNFWYFRDTYVDAIAGAANSVLAWHPGAFQFANWNRNKGENRMITELHSESTIVDPFTGIELDIIIHYDDCADPTPQWQIQISTQYDLFGTVPADAFPAGHDLEDTNGGLLYQAILS